MSFELYKIIFFIIIKIFFLSSALFASLNQDCLNSSFYIKNVNVDLTKESINKARTEAEEKSKLIGFKRLANRLIINKSRIIIDAEDGSVKKKDNRPYEALPACKKKEMKFGK